MKMALIYVYVVWYDCSGINGDEVAMVVCVCGGGGGSLEICQR